MLRAVVVSLLRLHPSHGAEDYADDNVAQHGAYVISCMAENDAPSKALFLAAGAEEALRAIVSAEETSGDAKKWARSALHKLGQEFFFDTKVCVLVCMYVCMYACVCICCLCLTKFLIESSSW